MTTPYHVLFFAYELTRQGSDGVGRLSRSLSHLQEKIKDLEKKKRRQR